MSGEETNQSPAGCERHEAALVAAGVVGTWEWDHRRKVARYSAGAAELLAGDPALAGCELSAEAALAGVYTDDVAWLRDRMRRAMRAPGVSVREHRVRSDRLGIRRVLCRGRTYHDANGRPSVTMGVVIDITEIEADGRRRFVLDDEDPLNRAAEYGVADYEAVERTGVPRLLEPARLFLMALGREITRGLSRRKKTLH